MVYLTATALGSACSEFGCMFLPCIALPPARGSSEKLRWRSKSRSVDASIHFLDSQKAGLLRAPGASYWAFFIIFHYRQDFNLNKDCSKAKKPSSHPKANSVTLCGQELYKPIRLPWRAVSCLTRTSQLMWLGALLPESGSSLFTPRVRGEVKKWWKVMFFRTCGESPSEILAHLKAVKRCWYHRGTARDRLYEVRLPGGGTN